MSLVSDWPPGRLDVRPNADAVQSNENEIAQVYAAGLQDVDDAVAAARKAFRGPWAKISATARGELLMKLASLVETNASVLATIEAWDGGEYRIKQHS